ncbi:probable inactive receptor kinase At5g10020 [Aristolochia californica]|uniref:probable inactive receptor kinase At5g10020 n=1 Tax=Aristolochia californica TaxID=171875 RepID=UPI0035E16DAD
MQLLYLLFMLWVELALSKSDSEALLDFKEGIQIDPSGHVMSSWAGNSLESGQCPVSWYGIGCSKGHVVSITLDYLGLKGSVDFSALTDLKALRNLSISNNNLMGILPAELGSVDSLEFLDLSGNSFHGLIPVDLVNLENLVYMNLSSNKLSGPMPSTFGNLLQLKYFDLHSNDLSGNVGSILNQFPSVVYLDLSSNGLSGSLNLSFNKSTFVRSLLYLNVSHNDLVGELFGADAMPLFDSLEVFDASYNQLVGQIPPFNFVVSLRILRLGNNQFSGSLPEAFLHESSLMLTELDVSCNQLQGPMGSITSTTLKRLNLSSNALSGSLPAKVGHIAIVDLNHNLLTGNLSTIRNWGNYVEEINLSSNSLSGTLPNDTSQFLRLTSINVSNNSLQGVVPLVIGTYPELRIIDLSLNQLTGSIPPNLFASLRLTYLNLSHNQFLGPNQLPVSTQGASLEFLDLSDNLFSGTLHPEISSMNQLKLLNLGRNNITGHIPREIGELDNLVYLDLSNNLFEGPIPTDFPSVLKYLNVSCNNLSGTVPANLLRFPDSSFHPGNFLLKFPPGASSKNGSEIMLGSNKGMKSRKAALIAACIGGAAFIACFMMMIYYWTRRRVCNGKEVFTRNIENKDAREGRSLPHLFGIHKGPKPPTASSSFSQDQLLSSKSGSATEHGDVTVGPAESIAKAGLMVKSPTTGTFPPEAVGKTVMASFSTSAPYSGGQHLPKHPVVLDVCSPDRLAGDLHLFDNTFQLTAEELSGAPAEVIGRSCHGTTYKATLGSGRVLTVKWLREGITKSKKEFAREAKKLGNIRHQNIISLRGYYWGQKELERLIISDYVHAKSLNAHLFGAESSEFQPLSLIQRLKVATDIARGLSYLHNERAIPHGNLKSANILLEGFELNTYLADYSLHRLLNPAGTAEQVLNSGALGYRPPEFTSTSKPCPSLKSDIYAFGVVLLEILTGKCAGEIVTGNPGVVDLTDWVRLLANGSRAWECLDDLIPGVKDNVDGPPKGLEEMLNVSLRCILPASERPDIRTVLEDLSRIVL